MAKAIRNDFAQPVSPFAQNLYQDMIKRNEKPILQEADPKVTYVLDNNMQVAKFIALGGETEKRNLGEETFTLFGQTVKIPYEKIEYEIQDIATGNIQKAAVKYLDTKDTEQVSELYKEFYRLADFLCTQEVAMRGLLPELTNKGTHIADPKTGIPYVGAGYLQHYFGLTQVATNDARAYVAAVADVHRWAFASFNYQVKANHWLWKTIHDAVKNGDINSYGVGPVVDNIGVADFKVANNMGNMAFVPGVTMNERPVYTNNANRSDIANVLLQGQQAPQAAPNSIQPSQQPAAPTSGPVKAKKR